MKEDRETIELERDKKRWKVRRRIAIASFFQITILSLFFLIAPMLMDMETAKVVSQFNPIVISLIGLFSTIIMVYMGAATYSDVSKANGSSVEVTRKTGS